MNRKTVKMGISPMPILAIIFGIMGIIYLPIGLLVGTQPGTPDQGVFLYVFGGLGAVFLLVSGLLLCLWLRKRASLQQTYEIGEKLLCPVTDIVCDRSVNVNHRTMRRVICEWRDPMTGNVHVFRSRRLMNCPERLLGTLVPVYFDRYNEKHAYMDIDSVLSKIVNKDGL